MKLSIPHIKISSAGIGFILCLGMMIGLGAFLYSNADKTIEARKKRLPIAEVILNEAAYATAETPTTGDESDSNSAIEKDLPPVIDNLSDIVQVTPTETRTPLFPIDETDDIETDTLIEETVVVNAEKEIVASAPEVPPRIALVISDMGLSTSATETAIKTLPKAVTFAFAPYADDIDEWVKKSKRKGHDILISIPMEPKTFPNDDPGPNALLTSLPDTQNIQRLDWALSQTSGYVGIVNFMGSRFTAHQEKMSPVMQHLKGKNLIFLDSGSGNDSLIPSMARVNDIPYAKNDRFIDNRITANAIDEQLTSLENVAKTRGQAIGIGFPYPVTFKQISNWSKTLESKGILLVPISDLMSQEARN